MSYYETLGTLYRAKDLTDWEIWLDGSWKPYSLENGSNLLTEVVEISEDEAKEITGE